MAKKLHSNFRPHTRVRERGQITNHVTGEVITPPSMTKQEFARECDVNNILKQYSTTGMLKHVSANANSGMYADLPDSFDFQESLHVIKQAETAFMSLPSKLRARFDNEPSEFLAFCQDPRNGDELVALGLRSPPPRPPESEPAPAKPVAQPKAKGGDGGGAGEP